MFPKTLDVAIQYFKRYSFDALLISTHAPGMSAYNQVERKMAPLSKALTRLLPPHGIYGTHLDSSRKTIDSDLEKRNFKAAGEILVKVWEEAVPDKFPVVAEYLEKSRKDSVEVDEKWISA